MIIAGMAKTTFGFTMVFGLTKNHRKTTLKNHSSLSGTSGLCDSDDNERMAEIVRSWLTDRWIGCSRRWRSATGCIGPAQRQS